MPRTVSRRGPSRLVVFASDDRDAGFTNDSNRAVQQRLDKLDAEAEKVAQKLDDAWADLRKHPRKKILKEIVQYLQKEKADLDERRKLLEAKLSGAGVGTAVASVSGAGVGAGMDAYEQLAQGYSAVPDVSTSKTSTAAKRVACTPARVCRWRVSKQELEELDHLKGMYVVPPQRLVMPVTPFEEEGSRDAFMAAALSPVNAVAVAEASGGCDLLAYTKPGVSMTVPGQRGRSPGPDYSGNVCVAGIATAVLAVGEGKTPAAMSSVADDLTSTRFPATLRKIIRQAWGYMMFAPGDPEAGFFGTPNRVWFFRGDRDNNIMFVTDAIHCQATSPSIRQMLYLLLRLKGKPLPPCLEPWSPDDYSRIFDEGRSSGQVVDQQQDQQDGQIVPVSGSAMEGGSAAKASDKVASFHLPWPAVAGHTQPSVISAVTWRMGAPLGYGITAQVYSGVSPCGLPVAIKVPSHKGRRKQSLEEQIQQLVNEVVVMQVLSPLQGLIIPKLVAYGILVTQDNDHLPCVVMEELQGSGPLCDVALEQLPATLEADAMALVKAVHAFHVAHNDIKEDNVFLMHDGTLRLLDFGHATVNSSPAAMSEDIQELRCMLDLIQHRKQLSQVPQSFEVQALASGRQASAGAAVYGGAGQRA